MNLKNTTNQMMYIQGQIRGGALDITAQQRAQNSVCNCSVSKYQKLNAEEILDPSCVAPLALAYIVCMIPGAPVWDFFHLL